MSLNNKFPKYGKYGIVLVAAITVATAVQAQNITTHYAYAEEVTANDPALNRMLYLDYSIPSQPERSWLTGDVVTPAGYTVEPADEVEGFPYYTITGSDGKNYSVGDSITVEDPLVNHANPEDNVLYYRYYSVDPNASTSTAPATSETPAPSTSETQSTSTAPATSETPAVEKPSQKTDDKTTATDKAKDANSKKAAATKDNSVANKAAEKSNATSAPTEQAKDTTAKTNNPDTGNSQSIVKEAAGTVDTAAVNHNDNNGFLALLGFVAAALIGLFQSKSKKEK